MELTVQNQIGSTEIATFFILLRYFTTLESYISLTEFIHYRDQAGKAQNPNGISLCILFSKYMYVYIKNDKKIMTAGCAC